MAPSGAESRELLFFYKHDAPLEQKAVENDKCGANKCIADCENICLK